jgi:hypothetical protein
VDLETSAMTSKWREAIAKSQIKSASIPHIDQSLHLKLPPHRFNKQIHSNHPTDPPSPSIIRPSKQTQQAV